jgi:hypothetical protein
MAYKEPEYNFFEICSNFCIYGDFLKAAPFGSGHINGTYKALYSQAGTVVPYILQKINTDIFKEPDLLMENICRVVDHMKSKYGKISKNVSRRTLTLVPSKNSGYLYKDKHNSYWRMFFCLENMATYDVIESEEMAYHGARAFGRFQYLLSDLPQPRLHDTIPNFHNTPWRFETFEKAIKKDVSNRAVDVKEEIDMYMAMKPYASKLLELYNKGLIPERICHNDTKLNNVMLDNETGESKCVIDLDTVMPGFVAYDFGDLVRTGTCIAEEDEIDTSKIVINMDMFKSIAWGYLNGASGLFSKAEKDSLVLGGIVITLEIGLRFLTDHLQNDIYFKIHRPHHNLDRARAQMALVKQIEKNYDIMCNIVKSI